MITKEQRKAIINAGMPMPLMNAILQQIGGAEAFIEAEPKIREQGAQEGYPGFTLYIQTIPFAINNLEAIMAVANEEAKLFGTSAYGLKGIHCHMPGGASKTELAEAIHLPTHLRKQQALNALAWYILELAAHKYYLALQNLD